MKPFLFSLKFPKIWVGYVSFKWYFEKGGSVGRWETNQFIGMAIQEMKADQKYSKVVGIKGGGGGVISMKLKEQLRGIISMKSMNFKYNWVLAVKKAL